MMGLAMKAVRKTRDDLVSRRFLVATSITLLLSGLTLLMVHSVPRYRPVGPDLAPWVVRGHLAREWLGWGDISVSGPDSITLRNGNPEQSSVLRLAVPVPKTHLIHVDGTFETKGLSAGNLAWQRARCFLLAKSGDGEWHWAFPGLVFSNAHDGAVTASFVAVVPPDITDIQVNLGLYGTTGSLTTRGVSIRAGKETVAFLFWRGVLVFAWIIWGVAILGRLWRTQMPYVALPAVLLVSVLMLVPEATKETLTQGLSNSIDRLVHQSNGAADKDTLHPTRFETERDVEHMLPPEFRLNRTTHVTVFALLALLLLWLNRRDGIAEPAAYLVLFAGATEVLQYYSPGRAPDITDFGFDVLGIAASVAIVLGLMWGESRLRGGPERVLTPGPSESHA